MTYGISSFSLMKNMNMANVLERIQQTNGISRAQIAKDTGLTPATVTNLVSELLKDGVIKECKTGESNGGRRPIILKMNPGKYAIASVYISPDKIEFMLLNLLAEEIYYSYIDYGKANDINECIEFIASHYNSAKNSFRRKIIGVSIGMHGIVDTSSGTSVFAPNLGWHNVELKKILEKKIDAPIFIDNDVRLMTLAEVWFGKAKNVSDMVYLYIGKGIGSTIIAGKEVYGGSSSAAGEIGHFSIDANGPLCSCGNRGCLQSFANTTAIEQYIKDAILATGSSTALTRNSTPDELVSAYKNGDEASQLVFEKEASYLTIAIGNIINMLNPEMIVIDSAINGFSELIIPYIEKQLPNRSMKYQREACSIKHSALGKKAVLKGGAALVFKQVYRQPDIIKDAKRQRRDLNEQ